MFFHGVVIPPYAMTDQQIPYTDWWFWLVWVDELKTASTMTTSSKPGTYGIGWYMHYCLALPGNVYEASGTGYSKHVWYGVYGIHPFCLN